MRALAPISLDLDQKLTKLLGEPQLHSYGQGWQGRRHEPSTMA
jgi:hypothetical protein